MAALPQRRHVVHLAQPWRRAAIGRIVAPKNGRWPERNGSSFLGTMLFAERGATLRWLTTCPRAAKLNSTSFPRESAHAPPYPLGIRRLPAPPRHVSGPGKDRTRDRLLA